MESATIWMGAITEEMDTTFITEAFSNMGYNVIEVKEIFHKTNGARANYCFVDFGDINIAREVLIKINNQPIPGTEGKKFKLNRSEYGRSSGGSVEYSLFVGDITSEVTDDHLLDFFRVRYPSVRAAKVVKDKSGKSKGFGFVRFFDEEEHERALKEMQGMKGLGQREIRVNKASKGKSQPANQFGNPTSGTDSSAFPGWMQMQMNYMQQMQQYMQQCQQFAQQAATYAGWRPQTPKNDTKEQSTPETTINFLQQQHEQMVSQSANVNEDLELVDPNPPVDVAALNQEIIDRDDRLFFEMEASKWDFETCVLGALEQRPIRAR